MENIKRIKLRDFEIGGDKSCAISFLQFWGNLIPI